MVIRVDIKKKNQVKLATYQSWVISYILNSPPSLLISFSGATPTLLFSAYLLKRWTTCNHLKLTETSWNHPQTTWNQSYYSNFLLKIKYLWLRLSWYSTLKCFLGKFGLQEWSFSNWLKFDTGVHCYILISNSMFIFREYLLFTKSEVLQIEI